MVIHPGILSPLRIPFRHRGLFELSPKPNGTILLENQEKINYNNIM